MAFRFVMPNGLPALVGIAGAGSRGSISARRYLEQELLPEYRRSGCCLMRLDHVDTSCPAVVIVIAFADDAGTREELAAWSEYLRIGRSKVGAILYRRRARPSRSAGTRCADSGRRRN
jgi:hypothetical protein